MAENKGKPSGKGKSQASVKDNAVLTEKEKKIREKYTEGPDDPADGVKVQNPNRNTDKVDNDNASYS